LDSIVEEEIGLRLGRVAGVEVARDRQIDEIDSVRAGRQQAGHDPVGQGAEAGGENLVARHLHVGSDTVGGEAVQLTGDPARDPGAVPFLVLLAAIGQPGIPERLLAVLAPERVAGDEGLGILVEVVSELLVQLLDAGVEDGDPDGLVAECRRPGGGHVHASVVPLEDSLRVRDAEERGCVVPRIREQEDVPKTGEPTGPPRSLPSSVTGPSNIDSGKTLVTRGLAPIRRAKSPATGVTAIAPTWLRSVTTSPPALVTATFI
jgi:hypothetical protein